MKSALKTSSSALLVFLSITVASGITSLNTVWFESDFIKTLQKQFSAFYHHAELERIYVQTDKTYYKPGETVWFAAYIRNEKNLLPSSQSDIVHVELLSPKGTTVKHYKMVADKGVAQGDFNLSGFPGGIYKIKAYTEWQKNEANGLVFEKEITLQNLIMPRLKMKLDFEKKAYGKADEVIARVQLNTNENRALSGTSVKFTVALAGSKFFENTATTDNTGSAQLKFKLPEQLNTADGILNVNIAYEGTTESISRSVPIVLNKIALEFFPEGGDLVASTANRLAFRATNEFGKPADVEGVIVDEHGVFVKQFTSYYLGMGSVDIVPQLNQHYKARIIKPAGILDEFNLPDVLTAGYTLKVEPKEKELALSVHSWQSEQLSLVAQTRGKIYFAKSFNASKGLNVLSINTALFPIGITQITLFDYKGIARAERLVFVNKNKQLHISVTPSKSLYQPREKAVLTIRVTDENGLPVAGSFSLSVVDDNLLSFADEKQGNILSKMLLEPELNQKVEEPNFYFDNKEAKANHALDLLMMTSGWRKYTWKQVTAQDFPIEKFQAEKAIYSGIVYDGYTYKPLPGAQLKLTASGKTVTTDKDGKFVFSKFDIAVSNQVQISAGNFQTQTHTIADYGTNHQFYLYNNQRRPYYLHEPMAALAKEERMNVFAEGDIAVKKGLNARQQADEANIKAALPAAPVMDWDNDPTRPKDVADDPEKVIPEQGVTGADIGDIRLAELMKFDKQVEQGNKIQFYRAKEFPERKFSKTDTTRSDFASTLYWNGHVSTDLHGRATVEFIVNDLVSSFNITTEGFGEDGSVGRSETKFVTGLPVSIDVKAPTQLVSGDKAMIPVIIKNNSGAEITGTLAMVVPSQLQADTKQLSAVVPAQQSKVYYLPVVASSVIGSAPLQIKFASEKYHDAITKEIEVVAMGFPANISLSGQDLQKDFFIHPTHVVPGSMKVSFTAYPNIMSELLSGVESILREPYGCFEQTSSANYPNIMALQYLQTMQINNPELKERATKLIDNGYKKLIAFETKENGYEWFGAAPAHEALTAYGLMEFIDMKRVYAGVDNDMIARTAKLLLDKRDGNGGFKKNPRALDSFGGADTDITNAYIVYALSEAGYKDIAKEMNAVEQDARKSNDPYLMALCVNALFNLGEEQRAEKLLTQIIKLRDKTGFWVGNKHSITRSTGQSLKAETTSLILIALLKSKNTNTEAINGAVKYLVGMRSGYGGFGSTQATVLTLKALTKYAEFSKRTDESGTIAIEINGKVVSEKNYAKGEKSQIVIAGLENFISSGAQKIQVRFKNCQQALPYAMNISYSTTLPENAKQSVIRLQTAIAAKQVRTGELLRFTATLTNITQQGQPMTMALLGIPAGFSAQPWQLKELMEKGAVDFYEITGNSIACYFRDLEPGEQKQINLDLKAEIPGAYSALASSAYLYYTSEDKIWAGLDKIYINP